MLRIGIAKGRGLAECLRLLDFVDVEPIEKDPVSVLSEVRKVRAGRRSFVIRGNDISYLLDAGYIDVAIGSALLFRESAFEQIMETTRLPVSKCRLSLIGFSGMDMSSIQTVAARFPKTAREHVSRMGMNSKILAFGGCLESLLYLKASDAIVDIVDTGETMRKFGLIELAQLEDVSHSVWSRRDPSSAVTTFIQNLVRVIERNDMPLHRLNRSGARASECTDSEIKSRLLIAPKDDGLHPNRITYEKESSYDKE